MPKPVRTPRVHSGSINIRRVVIVALIVGGFLYWTSHLGPSGSLHLPFWNKIANNGSPLELTEAHAQPTFDNEELNNIQVYKKSLPSVVNITSKTMSFDFFYGVVPQQGQGSGFVLDKQGHVLTNYHVVADAKDIQVTLSNKNSYKARPVGSDQAHDLALLQIDAPDLTPAVLSDSKDLVVGEKVFAIGNPFGLSGTMTTGIISSIRSIHGPSGAPIENAIQTDAAINPGNSGGPLLNSRGEVIGINSLIATGGAEQSAGIGFAIPINTAKAVLADIAKYGRVRRPSLGIVSLPIGPDLAQQMGLAADYGILIQRTLPGGAAERAGLHGGNQQAYLGNTPIYLGGDLIVAIDNQEVASGEDVTEVMNRHEAGDMVTITFFRGKKKMTTRLALGELRAT